MTWPRTLGRIDWASKRILLYLVVAAVLSLVLPVIRRKPGELIVYTKAASRLVQGEQFYRPEEDKVFSYPPCFALPFAPVAPLPLFVQRSILYFTNLILLGAIVFRVVRRAEALVRSSCVRGPPTWVLWLVVVVLSGRFVISPVEYQSHDVIVFFLVRMAVMAWAEGQEWRSGLWAGLGVACKATPLLFVMGFLSKLQFRALTACLLAAAVATLLPDLLFPRSDGGLWIWSWYENFVSKVGVGKAADTEGVWSSWNRLNQSLAGTVHRLTTTVPEETAVKFDISLWHPRPETRNVVITALQIAIMCFVVFVCIPRHGRGLDRPSQMFQRFGEGAAVLCAMLLLSPMSSKQHFGAILFSITFCTVDFLYRRRTWIVGLTLLLVFMLGTLGAKDLIGRPIGNLLLAYGSLTFCSLACLLATGYVLVCRPRDLRAMQGTDADGKFDATLACVSVPGVGGLGAPAPSVRTEDANTAQAVIAMTLAEGPKVKARFRFDFGSDHFCLATKSINQVRTGST